MDDGDGFPRLFHK